VKHPHSKLAAVPMPFAPAARPALAGEMSRAFTSGGYTAIRSKLEVPELIVKNVGLGPDKQNERLCVE
jgi:hypothetical protein